MYCWLPASRDVTGHTGYVPVGLILNFSWSFLNYSGRRCSVFIAPFLLPKEQVSTGIMYDALEEIRLVNQPVYSKPQFSYLRSLPMACGLDLNWEGEERNELRSSGRTKRAMLSSLSIAVCLENYNISH